MFRDFIDDTRATITAFVMVLSVGMFMMAGLVLDTGRAFSAHSQMQAFVDAVSLAAASELDGEPDAMDRARSVVEAAFVAANLTQTSTFASAATETFTVDKVVFLTGQPTNTGGKLVAANLTGLTNAVTPETATHVLVQASPVDVPWSLLNFASAGGAAQASRINSWATATLRKTYAPDDLITIPMSQATLANLSAGKQLRLTKNTDGVWSEGEYGINLDIHDDIAGTCAAFTGTDLQHCLMAINSQNTPFGTNTVSFTSDSAGDSLSGSSDFDVHAALNTRFGIYDPSVSFLQNLTEVSSDVSTFKGHVYSCTGPEYGIVADTVGLPRDPCFHTGTCSVVSNNSISQDLLEIYWEHTHKDADENSVSGNLPAGIDSRYDMYKYEVESHFGSGVDLTTNGNENNQNGFTVAGDACNTYSTAKADRRKFTVAIVDGTTLSGEAFSGVEVLEYAEVFLTEPVGHDSMVTLTFDGFHNDGSNGGHTFGMGDVVAAGYATPSDGAPGQDYYSNLGVTFEVVRSRKNQLKSDKLAKNVPMLFDTSNYTGGDADLEHTAFGHVLIISEDGDATPMGSAGSNSWRRSGPDDEGGGGWILVNFDETMFPNGVFLDSVTLFDADNGGIIYTYDTTIAAPYGEYGNSSENAASPSLYAWDTGRQYDDDGDGSTSHPGYDVRAQYTTNCADTNGDDLCDDNNAPVQKSYGVAVPKMHDGDSYPVNISRDNVKTFAYFMPNSGGIDNIRFLDYTGQVVPMEKDSMYVEFIDLMQPNDPRVSYNAVISN